MPGTAEHVGKSGVLGRIGVLLELPALTWTASSQEGRHQLRPGDNQGDGTGMPVALVLSCTCQASRDRVLADRLSSAHRRTWSTQPIPPNKHAGALRTSAPSPEFKNWTRHHTPSQRRLPPVLQLARGSSLSIAVAIPRRWETPKTATTLSFLKHLCACCSDDVVRSRAIDKELRAEERRAAREVKLLLLGAGESGKSTILKQMKLIYASGFSRADRDNYRCIIFSNILHSLKTVLVAMEAYGSVFEIEENEGYRDLVSLDRTLTPGEQLPAEYLAPFKSLWADKAVRRTVERGNEYALHDNLSYFFQDLDRLFATDYVPSNQDVLRSRLKTTGITETIFDLGTLTYRMFDVGGQRSERKKWIHCFENVTCVLFLVAISGYDQCLVEEMDGNQMQEAFMLFESISNSRWFTKTCLILFLNKMDLFRTKLVSSPITKYFPDYEGNPTDAAEASRYFRDRFLELSRDPKKEVYTHFTNATDTDLLGITMASVQDMIIQRNLNNMYFA